jgi:hypothetical protein
MLNTVPAVPRHRACAQHQHGAAVHGVMSADQHLQELERQLGIGC